MCVDSTYFPFCISNHNLILLRVIVFYGDTLHIIQVGQKGLTLLRKKCIPFYNKKRRTTLAAPSTYFFAALGLAQNRTLLPAGTKLRTNKSRISATRDWLILLPSERWDERAR